VRQRALGVQIKAQLRWLHGYLAIELFGAEPFQHTQVMLRGLVGFLEPVDVLA
jgi:hypothetical protein